MKQDNIDVLMNKQKIQKEDYEWYKNTIKNLNSDFKKYEEEERIIRSNNILLFTMIKNTLERNLNINSQQKIINLILLILTVCCLIISIISLIK